ncbi:MAG: TIGR03089 family protein [Actinomycetes bacterium]
MPPPEMPQRPGTPQSPERTAATPERAETPDALLREALGEDPSRPLLTFYDDETGERVELSVATYENWVAKTANLLVDGLAVEPGSTVALLLPLHWQAAVWLSACWAVGVVAEPGGDPAAADVVVSGPDTLEQAAAAGAPDTVGLSLRPMNARLSEIPEGVTDYAAEVLTYGDRFVPAVPPAPSTPALRVGSRTWSGAQVTAAARDQAAAWGLGRADRVLTATPFGHLASVTAGLLAPLAAGAGIVLCRHLDEVVLARRVADERVTAVVGMTAPGGSGIRAFSVPS